MHPQKRIACALMLLLIVDAKPHFDHSANKAPIIETTDQREDDKQVETPAEMNLNITCKSKHPINWMAYDAHFDWTPPSINSSSYYLESKMLHVSILTISNTSASSVGRYYCVRSDKIHEHLDEMVTEGFASSVYVFVIDYKQPIVPTKEKSYYPTHDKLVIPCKPSYPDIEVELCNKDEKCLTVYDPTNGFTIPKTSSIIPEDGKLYCRSGNTSVPMNVLVTEDWFDHIYDPDNTAPAVKHISHTCTIFFAPGDKVMVKVDATSKNQQTDDNEKNELEAPPPEMRYPITISMTSGNSQTPLNTKDCEVIDLQCNVTGLTHSVLNWYKNGVPVGLRKNISSVPRSQTILSFEGYMPQDDQEVGDYECRKENLYETTQGTPQLETTKGIPQIEITEEKEWSLATRCLLCAIVVLGGVVCFYVYKRIRSNVINGPQYDRERLNAD